MTASGQLEVDLSASASTTTFNEPCLTTTRHDWIQRTLQGLPDFLHVVSSDGRIRYASESCRAVVGYDSDALLNRYVHTFIHPDDLDLFKKEFHEAFVYGIPVRFIYRFWSHANRWVILESQCNIYCDEKHSNLAGYRELIIVARQYLHEQSSLLDSFLEQKTVYERLIRRKKQLEMEEEKTSLRNDTPPPDQPSTDVYVPCTQQRQVDQQQLGSRTHVEVTSLTPRRESTKAATCLQKPDPVIAQADCAVPVGDLGIPITVTIERKRQLPIRKQRRPKNFERCICKTCGAIETPEWRKGPDGPKTLCNSCGCGSFSIRYEYETINNSALVQEGKSSSCCKAVIYVKQMPIPLRARVLLCRLENRRPPSSNTKV